jgi:hypothetical protein
MTLDRARVALALVLLYAGASSIRWLANAVQWPANATTDEISAHERRFEALRSALPKHGTVGYVGSPEPIARTPKEADSAALLHFRRHLLAQYTLAPVLLIKGTASELVVGNFDRAAPPAPPGLSVVRDFGDGLVLFRRTAP